MSDWSAETADTIERLVVSVRDKSVVPAQKAVRGVVFGIIILMLAVVAAVVMFFGAFHLLNRLLPGKAWVVHYLFAAIFFIIGGVLFSRRTPQTPK